ncbi:MAG: HD domain-containing phosphohydrolase [Candidatus Omnitrophota bacterium]
MLIILIFFIVAMVGLLVFFLVKIFTKARISPLEGVPNSVAPVETVNPELEESGILEEKIWYKEELAFLFKLNEKMSLSLDKSSIARHLVEEVRNFMNTADCVLLLEDKNSEDIRVEAVSGPRLDSLKNFLIFKGESITGKVLANKEPLLVNNLKMNSYYNSINQEFYLGNAFISVPLLIQGLSIGALNVTAKKTGESFTKRDEELLINVARMGAVAFNNFRLHEQIQEDYLKTITTLALILDARDPYTKRHSENVTRYSVAIAVKMGFSPAYIELIRRAALLHDIGKIGIRDDILLKPGKLTEEEFEQIKIHPLKSYEIVASLSFLKDVSFLVRHHHERYDGKGYPDGKAGEDIEFGARILAVSDSFDAMTTDRPYRKRLSFEAAKSELIRCQSTQFDPKVVDSFISILESNPAIAD